MRYRTLEIRWHDSRPISSCDFQHVPLKRSRPATADGYAAQAYRLATGGEDHHVRLWMVYPNIVPTGSTAATGRPPRVEYLATLSRHSSSVNVVRFSPNGELIASAGDDGMVIIWAQSSTSTVASYGNEDEAQYEKEHWKPRTTFQCGNMQVYDLAWSPTGDYIITGSTDNTARVFTIPDGKCVYEIAEHSHFVQGVAWDPMNEYIATQSSDRSMHVYKISTKNGHFEAHAVGKNTRMSHHQSRTPSVSRHGRSTTPNIASGSRPRPMRSESVASDTESIMTTASEQVDSHAYAAASATPLTPATSVSSSSMFPPVSTEKASSRRSSFSGSQAPNSPAQFKNYGRSPSPMPALPAIRTPPTNTWSSSKLYGDESFSNFFRRLTFSTDGGLLLTPAGQFEDPSVTVKKTTVAEDTPARGRKTSRPVITTDTSANPTSTSSVYIYSRANFARPPIAQLPGHKKASVAVKFSPVLYELRQGVVGAETQTAVLEKGRPGELQIDLTISGSASVKEATSGSLLVAPRPIVAPTPILAGTMPLLDPQSKPSTPAPGHTQTGSVFALPYRMLFAVVTMDTVAIYDTQQSGPVCLLTKLHYDEFTDLSWSPDGQCLILSARDGYCTLIIFDDIIPAHHTQQNTLQLQSLTQHSSLPIAFSTPQATPVSLPPTPQHQHVLPIAALPTHFMPPLALSTPSSVPQKRNTSGSESEATPAAEASGPAIPITPSTAAAEEDERPKKKRRVALTRVGDLA